MAASLKRMANIFPEWISLGRQGNLLQVSHEAFSEMSAQVIHYVGEYRRRVPQGIFKENDDFSAILKNIDYLERGDLAISRETQLQSCSQDSPQEFKAPRLHVRRRSSQNALYYDFVKLEFQRLLSRSKTRSQAISQPGDDYDSYTRLNAGCTPKFAY